MGRVGRQEVVQGGRGAIGLPTVQVVEDRSQLLGQRREAGPGIGAGAGAGAAPSCSTEAGSTASARDSNASASSWVGAVSAERREANPFTSSTDTSTPASTYLSNRT